MTDPYAHLRHLDRQPVTVRTTDVIEDPDGNMIGVNVQETAPAPLSLPAPPDDVWPESPNDDSDGGADDDA